MPRLKAAVVCCLLLWCSPGAAQDNKTSRAPELGKPLPAAEPMEAAPRRAEESQPSLYYLKDKQGALQAVPNFTFEDFEELYKLKHQILQGDQRPRYSLQQLSATGTVAAGGYAELNIQFRILVREEQWTRVPLRLDQAMLREPVQYQGPGEQVLHFEGEGEGYVAWIRGPAGQQHQLTMKMLVPLSSVGEETRLRLLAPRATASELRLRVPIFGAMAKVSEGSTLQTPVSTKNDTEFTVLGLAGDFEMNWYRTGARVAEVPTVLEASGAISTRIDNRGIDAEATLSVRSYGAAFDRFRVRLPPEADLVPGNPTGYTVMPVEEDTVTPGSRPRLVEVRLAKRTTGPVEVRLATNRAYDMTKSGSGLELAGFEVVGAARQWGTIAVSAVGEWQVLWGPSRGVRQIDQLPEPLRHKDVVAGFDYSTQPCSLTASLVSKKTRINVEPEYLLLVDADQVRLEARLRYTVRGAKIYALEIAMPDWQLDEVGPDNLVAVDAVPTGSPNSSFSIPLVQPSVGQFEVRIRAHRPLAAEAKSLAISLPQPQVSAPASAVVVVLPADNVELIPDSKAMAGLFRQQAAVPLELPARQQEPLFYRSESPKAVFAADLRRHTQRISVDVVTQVSLDGQGGRVEQKLAYMVSYEPTDHFTLEVPRSLADSGWLELKCNGQAVSPIVLIEDNGDSSKPVLMRVPMSKARIGLCEVTARYPLTPQRISPEKRTVLAIPLVMPAEGELSSNKLYVTSAAELHVEPRVGLWTPLDPSLPRPGLRRGVQLVASQRSGHVELDVHGELGSETAVVVERAWIQTWLTNQSHAARQDRAVFQFTSNRREVEVTIPSEAALDQVSLLLDGKRAVAQAMPDGSLVVPLASDGVLSRHLLDVRYHFVGPRPSRGAMSLDLPRLGSDVWVRRMYWQLVLPREEHIVVSPGDFTAEFRWGWTGFFWGRQPLLDQAQLETWVGSARPSLAPVPAGANCYLFSTLGTISHGELRTASRSVIVLAASGAALLIGLLLIYLPAARHPATLLTATVLVAAVGLQYPEPALLAAQAAVVGLLLSLLAGLLSRGLVRRPRSVPFDEHPSSLSAAASLSGRSQFPVVGASSATYTQVSPAPAMSSDAEP